MKKTILLFLILLVAVSYGFAQDEDNKYLNNNIEQDVFQKIKHYDWEDSDWSTPYFQYVQYNEYAQAIQKININIETGDSISRTLYEYFNETSDYILNERTETYENGSWIFSAGRRLNITEVSANIKECVFEIYNGQEWLPNVNCPKKKLTYDETGKLIELAGFDIVEDSNLKTEYIPSFKYEFQYNETNEIEEILQYFYMPQAQELFPTMKIIDFTFIEFVPEFLVLEFAEAKEYDITGQEEILFEEITTEYGEYGSYTSSSYVINFQTNELELFDKCAYTYNEHQHLVEIKREHFVNGEVNELLVYMVYTETYNNNEELTEVVYKNLNYATQVLENIYKEEYLDVVNSVTNVNKTTAFNIFPNPSSNLIHISLDTQQENIKIELLNLQGQIVYHSNTTKQIDISNLESGMYFVKLSLDGKQENIIKFMKK